jgi:hypothetical protein
VRIDDLLAEWHFRDRHRAATTAAAADLLAAVEQVTWAEVPVMRVLMRVRSAGHARLASTPYTPRVRPSDNADASVTLGAAWSGAPGDSPGVG